MTTDISSASRTLLLDFAGARTFLLRATCRPYRIVGSGRTGDLREGRLPRSSHARRSPRHIADEWEVARMNVDVIVAAGKYLGYLMRRGMATL